MYEPLLLIHSWTRWAVICSIGFFFAKSTYGWLTRKPWTTSDATFIWAFNQVFGYQVLFGVALWLGASPIVKAALRDPSLALENGVLSFWTIRHGLTMILALGAFHIGKARARRAPIENQYRIYSLMFLILTLLVFSAIPWPWLSYGRPFFRWFL